MPAYSVKLVPLGKTLSVRAGTPLLDVLHEYGVEFPCGGKGTYGRCRVRLLKGDILCDQKQREKLKSLGLEDDWRLACLSRCDSDLILEVGQFETVIQADETPFEFEVGKGLGIAFNMGTTTLVVQLLDLATGKILAVEPARNPQKKYGSDLISRMETALAGHGDELVRMIRKKVNKMVLKLMEANGTELERMVIVGNMAMHHLFCGHEVRPLAFYPFESPHMDMALFSTEELGWKGIHCERVEYYPAIGSFVGSDILAGILATGMHKKEGRTVLLDLGTNGEIVVGNRLLAWICELPPFPGQRISGHQHHVRLEIFSCILQVRKEQSVPVVNGVIPDITDLEHAIYPELGLEPRSAGTSSDSR